MLVISAWEGSSLDQRKMQKEVFVGFPCFLPPVAEMDCLNPEVLAMRRKLLASYHQIGGLKSSWTLGVADRTSPSTGFWLEVCLRKGAVVSQESGRRKAVSRLRYTLEVSDMVTRHMPFWKAAFKLAEELLHKSDRPFVYHEVVSQLIWQVKGALGKNPCKKSPASQVAFQLCPRKWQLSPLPPQARKSCWFVDWLVRRNHRFTRFPSVAWVRLTWCLLWLQALLN